MDIELTEDPIMGGKKEVDTPVESPTNSGVVHSDDDDNPVITNDNPVITNDSDPVMGEKPRVSRYLNNFRVTHSPQFRDNYTCFVKTPRF